MVVEAGTKSSEIIATLRKIPIKKRNTVLEVTLDMSNTMDAIITGAFPNADIVIDRFHVQQLVTDAVQEIRIAFRKKAIRAENKAILLIREKNKGKKKEEKETYVPFVFDNEDTKKQLLARSRYLLFKPSTKWTEKQKERAVILFKEFPKLKHAYNLSMLFRSWYETNTNREQAKIGLSQWYEKIEKEKIEPFLLAADSIKAYEDNILNYFNHRSTNAAAESFNAKLKGFRALVRGVTDVKFFLFRVAKLYG